MAPNPSGTVSIRKRERSSTVFPSLEEVLKVAAQYPGDPVRGIQPGIPESWARSHFNIRTYEKKCWVPNWPEFMISVFEALWRPDQPNSSASGKPFTPKRRQRWQIEKDLKSIQDEIVVHPRFRRCIPWFPDPKGDGELTALRARCAKLKDELKTCD
jgi:hypothetical protein